MRVLVAYATRHGATAGIAKRIASSLEMRGLDVDCEQVSSVKQPERFDAFVIGSAAYAFHWLGETTSFVRRHRLAVHLDGEMHGRWESSTASTAL